MTLYEKIAKQIEGQLTPYIPEHQPTKLDQFKELNGDTGYSIRGNEIIINREPLYCNGIPDGQNDESKTILSTEISRIVKEHEKSIENIPDVEILDRLLSILPQLNFREKAGITDDKKQLANKHYAVAAIDEILETARRQKYGLSWYQGAIYCYNGSFWQKIEPEELKHFLGKAAAKLGVDTYDAKYYKFQDELLRQFLATAHLPKVHVAKGKNLINLLNGTFEIIGEKQFLREHRSEDFLTYKLPFVYDRKAEAPQFHKYLNQVLPDEASQKNIAEYLGSVFVDSKDLKLEKVLLLQGNGSNGKSVIQEIIIALFGEQNVSNFNLQSLTDQTGYYRAELANKLVNVASEINGKVETSMFKQLASGEPIEVRSPYGKPFNLRRYGKMIFNCNLLPTDVEQTDAFYRRWLLIEFGRSIKEDEKDVQLHNKIIENELSGVFNWVLAGLNRLLLQKGFTKNQTAKDSLDQFRKQGDSVAMFLDEENYIIDINEITPQKELYKEYGEFCLDSGYRRCSNKTFGDRLTNLGFLREKRNIGKVVFITKKGS